MNYRRNYFLVLAALLLCAGVVSAQNLSIAGARVTEDTVRSSGLYADTQTPDAIASPDSLASPTAATRVSFVQQPKDAKAGAIIAPPVTVQLKDLLGRNVAQAGVSISLSISSGTGTLSGSTTRQTSDQGLATFDDLSIDLIGSKKLTASSPGLSSATSKSFDIKPGEAARLQIHREPSETATAGVPFAQQPEVWVVDAGGNLVTTDNSTAVTASRLEGTGALQGTLVVMARNGIVSFSNLSHKVANSITVLFTSGSLITDTSAAVSVKPAAAALLAFLQPPTNATAGTVIAPPVTVRLKDAFGNDVEDSGTPVVLELTSGSGTLSGTRTKSTASGIATFDDLSIDLTGEKRLTASSGDLTSVVSDAFIISAGEAKSLAFIQQPTNTEASAPITPPVTVQLHDSLGNDVPLAGVSVTLQLASGTGTLSGTTTKSTDGTGLVVFNDLSINQAGPKILRATSGVLTPDLSKSFAITAAAESKITFVQQPTNAIAGQDISPAVTVQLLDSLGNEVAKAGVSILVALGAGSTGTLSGTTVQLTDISGLATFGNLSIDLIGVKTLTAVASGLDQPESNPFTVSPASPSRLVFTQSPSNSIAGTPFSTQPIIALQDQYRNPVNGAVQDVSIAIQTNAGGDGVLSGVTTVPVDTATGTATFAGLSIDKSGIGYTLTATGSTISTIPGAVISTPFDIAPASASQVRVETEADGSGTILGTQSVSSGTSITVFSVARDAFGNFVSNSEAAVWSLLDRTGGVVPSDLAPSADRRAATFTGGAVGSAVINAVVTGLTSIPSGTVTVVNNEVATRIRVETAANGTGSVVQDQTLPSGSSLVVYAIARDLNNNFVSNVAPEAWSLIDATGEVLDDDLVPMPGGKSASLTGRLMGTARIQATLHNLSPTPTGIITVTFGPPSVVAATTGTPQVAKVGTPFEIPLSATVSDAAGNPVNGIAVTFTAPIAGAGGSFEAGQNTVVTSPTGLAAAPVFTANYVAGTYNVTASALGAPTVATFVLTNSAQAVGRITTVRGTPQTTQVGTIFPTRFEASVQDSFGNPVSGAEVTFSAPPTGASGAFPNGELSAIVTTDAAGIGAAPDFTANFEAGAYVVSATAPGLAGSALFALTNSPGAAASIASVLGSQQSAEVNTPYPTRLQVVVKDSSGNAVSGVMVTFVAPEDGPSGDFQWGGTVNAATDTNGLATAPQLTANTIAGTFAVVAYAQGVSTPVSFELANLPGRVNAFLINADDGGTIGTQMVGVPFDIRILAQDRFGNISTPFSGTVDLSSSGALTQGAGITPSFIGGVLARHTVAVQNAGRVVLFALRTGGAEIGQSDSFQVNNPAPDVTGLSPATGARGESLTLTVTGSGFLQGVTSVLLGNNITTFEAVASDSQIALALNIGLDALEGPRTVFVINPPPGGGIASVDGGFLVDGIVYPATYTLQNTIPFPSHTQNSEYEGTDYRIVGFPGAAEVPISQFLPGSHNQDWAVYWDNGASSDYLVSFDGTSTFNLSPGRAFWLLQKGPLVINETVPSVPLDSTTSVEISLHPGWNLICNPFTFPVAWADVQSANEPTTLGGVYSFDGSFSISDALSPFQGCLYDNAGNAPSLVIPFREARLWKQEVMPEGSWRVEVELTVGEYVERLVSFGVTPGAEGGRDQYDWRRPRGVGTLPEAYFSHPEWGPEGGAFATDIRPVTGELETWQMEVHAKRQQQVHLSFAGVSSVPDHYRVVLVHEDRGCSVDLQADPVYSFTAATQVSHVRIAVGSDDAIRGLLEESMPREFRLENNFPNPFNPSTTIPVTVPWKSTVALRVYTILGELVRTVYAGPVEAGRHLFEWDGTNSEGRVISAGVYLIQLTNEGGQRFVGKMLLVK